MADGDGSDSDALKAAGKRRVELKEALSRAEIAAAAPSLEPGWQGNLARELEALRVALDDHVEEVERDDGLLPELARTAPRLVNQIARVRDEHPVLCQRVHELLKLVEETTDVDQIRAAVLETLLSIARHRQKGADLVFEGYNVDIGGG